MFLSLIMKNLYLLLCTSYLTDCDVYSSHTEKEPFEVPSGETGGEGKMGGEEKKNAEQSKKNKL